MSISFTTKPTISTPFNSKIQGTPYIPKGFVQPQGLSLLVQINFSEIKNAPEYFPKKGILQVWYDSKDFLLGCDFPWRSPKIEKTIEIIYHENLQDESQRYSVVNTIEDRRSLYLPTVKKDEEVIMNFSTYNKNYNSGIDVKPFFTQNDIREDYPNGEDLVTLLQIDSDKYVMIKDSGSMNLFITKEDLINLNFSNVIYNWDSC